MRRFLLLLLLVLAGCPLPSEVPDGGAVEPSGIDGTGEFLSEEARLAVIDEVMAARPANATAETHAAALVAALRRNPAIEAAGVSRAGNVWGRFIDGTLFLDFTHRPLSLQRVSVAAERRLLPRDPSAVTMNSLEATWTDVSAELGGWLSSTGYSTRGHLHGTVEELEGLRNVGVLFWQTHSGLGVTRSGQQVFAFVTSSVATKPPTPPREVQRRSGELTVVAVQEPDGGYSPRYGVTDAFIRARMALAFSPDALVALDSCSGLSGAGSWEAVGAGAVVSWDAPSGNRSQEAFEVLFDRLLGQNVAPPLSTPRERAFPLDRVRDWMQRTGLDLDPSPQDGVHPPARLGFRGAALLRPSIKNVVWEAPNAQHAFEGLFLEGAFASSPTAERRVRWGGRELEIVSWADTAIVVRVPSPPYPSGALEVVVDGRASERLPFSEWTLPVTAVLRGPGSLEARMELRLVLRGDVRGFREGPTEPLIAFVPMPTLALLDASGSITASGEWRSSSGQLLERWSGGGPLTAVDPGASTHATANYVGGGAVFYPAGDALLTLDAEGTYTVTPGGGAPTEAKLAPSLALVSKRLRVAWPSRTLLAGSADFSFGDRTLTVSWPNAAPVNAPGDLDGR